MSVVAARREVARTSQVPFWQRYYLDVLLLAIAGYGYYVLKGQGRIAFLQLGVRQDPLTNPLVFLAPAFCILAIALMAVRLFPWLMHLPDWAASQARGVSLLLALHNLTRAGHAHAGLLLILILSTGMGTFTASAARTIDENVVSRIRYRVGADVSLTEGVGVESTLADVSASAESSGQSRESPVFLIAPVEDHLRAPGVQGAARVGKFKGQVRLGGTFVQGQVYGIDRLDFPKVAFFRPDFSPQPLGALMNALALQRDGVLVSEDVLAKTGANIGDSLPIQGLIATGSDTVSFRIVGVLKYFPTSLPQDGLIFVANLDYIFEQIGGPVPYNVWLSVQDGTDLATLVSDLEEIGYRIISSEDARTQIAEAQRRPERTGLFGFLSIGFIITVGLSMLAQVVYALLSFRQRFIQFGMIRAIGLSVSQLAFSLSSELALITAAGVGVGLDMGLLISHMFLPFLQVGYTPADLVPPFMVIIAWEEVLKAVLAQILASLVTNIGVIWFLTRIKVFAALKLGESLV